MAEEEKQTELPITESVETQPVSLTKGFISLIPPGYKIPKGAEFITLVVADRKRPPELYQDTDRKFAGIIESTTRFQVLGKEASGWVRLRPIDYSPVNQVYPGRKVSLPEGGQFFYRHHQRRKTAKQLTFPKIK